MRIRNSYRTVQGTNAATCAFFLVDKAWLLQNLDAEITGPA